MAPDPGPTPAHDPAQPDRTRRAAHVRSALQQLSPEIRDVLVLTYFGGRSATDIAVTLGVPLQTVRRSIFQGLRTLGSSLDEPTDASTDVGFMPGEQRRRA